MFGFEARNGSGSVIVSDHDMPLTYKERGNLVVSNSVVDRPSTAVFNFSSSVTTQTPPTVFLRIISSRDSSVMLYSACVGSPGNWTGVRITVAASGGTVAPRYEFELIICQLKSAATTARFGMAIHDANGAQVFSDADRVVLYSKFTKKWTVSMTGGFPGYGFYTLTPTGITISSDDYIDISSINRGIAPQYIWDTMYTSVRVMRSGERVLELVTQDSVGDTRPDSHAYSNINFCMAVCKFPSYRYP